MTKSVKIADLIDIVNTSIAVSGPDMKAERQALASLLEKVLHDSGHYAGFRYLDVYTPDSDRTRVSYYTSRKLAHGFTTAKYLADERNGLVAPI